MQGQLIMNDKVSHMHNVSPQDIAELIKSINTFCIRNESSINQICNSLNTTSANIIKDREIASVGVSQLAEALHDAQKTQREINKELFDKIGNLSEAMLGQSKITAEQTQAIANVGEAINNLAKEFSEHRGKSEEREKRAAQAEEHTRASLANIGKKVDKANEETDELQKSLSEMHTRVTVIEKSREEKSGFLDSTFNKTIALLTLLTAVGAIAATVVTSSKPDHHLPPPKGSSHVK